MANQINLGRVIGATGETGATGEKGEAGANGLTPYIQNGTWWLGTNNTGVTAKGNEWLVGNSAPTTQGVDGDLFLINEGDLLGNVYKKIGGVWNFILNIKGLKGDTGEKGDKGDSALSVKLGTVTTIDAGLSASIVNSGTDTDLVLDFLIPRGEQGKQGEQGQAGKVKVYVSGLEVDKLEFERDPQSQINELANPDNKMSDISTNAVQNRVIKEYVDTSIQQAILDSWEGSY